MVAAAANAVLDMVDDEDFLADVRDQGRAPGRRPARPGLDVRGLGLMLAFAPRDAPELVRRALLEQRLVLNATGPDTVRLLPPLTVSRRRDRRGRAPHRRAALGVTRAAVRLREQPRPPERRCAARRRASSAPARAARLPARAHAAARSAGAAGVADVVPAPGRARCGARSTRSPDGALDALDAQGGRGLRLPAPGRRGRARRRAPTAPMTYEVIDKEPERAAGHARVRRRCVLRGRPRARAARRVARGLDAVLRGSVPAR